jgi:hypothetical protein
MSKNQDPGSGINIPDPQHWITHKKQLSVSDTGYADCRDLRAFIKLCWEVRACLFSGSICRKAGAIVPKAS